MSTALERGRMDGERERGAFSARLFIRENKRPEEEIPPSAVQECGCIVFATGRLADPRPGRGFSSVFKRDFGRSWIGVGAWFWRGVACVRSCYKRRLVMGRKVRACVKDAVGKCQR